MAENGKTRARRADGGGWSFAAALGLFVVAFMWDRLARPITSRGQKGVRLSPGNRGRAERLGRGLDLTPVLRRPVEPAQ